MPDLQDMQNHMRETIDQGLGELQAKQGKGGLPALPPSANVPPEKSALAMNAPPPDPTAATQINQQWGEADKAEQEVTAQLAPGGAAPPALPAPTPPVGPPGGTPGLVELGQTIKSEQEVAGQVANLAAPAAPPAAPASISLGQSINDVTGQLGQPKSVVDLGPKKIYVYKDMKITFKDGKVSDVQ
jgi:hypothetical protein